MTPKPERPSSAPATWTADAHTSAAPRSSCDGTLKRDLAGYAIAIVSVLVALEATRLGWSVLARFPFFLVFGVIFVASQWLSEGARCSLHSRSERLAPRCVGSSWASSPGRRRGIAAFGAIALTVNRLFAGRNRVAAALRASEGQISRRGRTSRSARPSPARPGRAHQPRDGAPSRVSGKRMGRRVLRVLLSRRRRRRPRAVHLAHGGRRAVLSAGTGYRRADGAGNPTCLVTMSVIDTGKKGARATGALMVLEDVTERRRAEDALRASEHHYRQLFRDNPQAMWVRPAGSAIPRRE